MEAIKSRTLYVKEVTFGSDRKFEVIKMVNTVAWTIGEVLSLDELERINSTNITLTVGR